MEYVKIFGLHFYLLIWKGGFKACARFLVYLKQNWNSEKIREIIQCFLLCVSSLMYSFPITRLHRSHYTFPQEQTRNQWKEMTSTDKFEAIL